MSPIGRLAYLQELDRVRRDGMDRIREVEREIEQTQQEIDRRRNALQAAETDAQTHDLRRQELEKLFEDEGAKMTERRMRLNRVRNEKELQALRHEIEVRKEANQQLEEQVIDALERMDVLNESRVQAANDLAEFEALAKEKIANSEERLRELKAQIQGGEKAREDVRGALDVVLLRRYELILERRGGVAVADVNEGICQGCHRMLPPQLHIELQRNPTHVNACPACHRILYWKPKPVGDSE